MTRRPRWLRNTIAAVAVVIAMSPMAIFAAAAATSSTTLTSGNSLTVACNGTRLTASRVTATSYSLVCSGTVVTTTTIPPTTTTTTTAPPSPPTNSPIYGLTIDDINNVSQVVAMEKTLPVVPTTRVVFDWNSKSSYEPASYYAPAIKSLDPVSGVMGELLDSGYEKGVTPTTFNTMVESYLKTLGSTVNIWEIGNEVNGNWTGSYSNGSTLLTDAYNDVAATGAQTALTLYANEYGANNCGDGASELTPVQYSNEYVPAAVRDGLTYVFESYYPTQCSPTTYPTSAQVATEMTALHAVYPNAQLGFGEMGLPNQATSSTDATAEKVMSWAYSLNPNLSFYVGGYFWWYGAEDLVSTTEPLYTYFVSALNVERTTLGG